MWCSSCITYFVLVNLILCEAEKIKYIATERPTVTFLDKKFIPWANTTSRRISRSNPFYYYNLFFESSTTISNNFSVHFYFYEWLSNQYKRGFVEMHWLACDLIHKDNFFGTALRQGKFMKPCPYPPGVYELYNSTIPITAIPAGFPFTKGRIYMNFTFDKTKQVTASGHIDMEIKELTIKKKKEKKSLV